jgi:tetratricopeptide (TPR) repeat protein
MLLTLMLLLLFANPQAPAKQAPAPDDKAAASKAFEEANALRAKNENDKALAAYDRALSLDATRADIHVGRCRTLAALTRHDEAIAACGQALALDPQNWEALRDRGHYEINLNRLDVALRDLDKAAAMKAGDYQIDYHLGLGHYLTGNYQKAVPVWQACVKDAPTIENKVACYAWLYPSLRRAGRDAEAANALDEALALGAKPDAAYVNRLMLFKGTLGEEEMAKQMEASPLQQATVGYSIGLWHELNGRAAKAREYYQKATASEARTAFGHVAATNALKTR